MMSTSDQARQNVQTLDFLEANTGYRWDMDNPSFGSEDGVTFFSTYGTSLDDNGPEDAPPSASGWPPFSIKVDYHAQVEEGGPRVTEFQLLFFGREVNTSASRTLSLNELIEKYAVAATSLAKLAIAISPDG